MFCVRQFSDVSVVDTNGELSRNNIHDFEIVLESLVQAERHNVVLNFADLKHLDYRLVQRLADRIIQFQCDGGDLKMANASGYVRSIIALMGLEEEFYTSLEDALLSFVQEGPTGELQ
jgi:anti-anti-sigma factor